MLKQTKRMGLGLAKTTGVFSFVEHSGWRRSRLLILGYHGIAIDDEHQWNPPLFFRQDAFRERLRLIKKAGCTVVTLDEASGVCLLVIYRKKASHSHSTTAATISTKGPIRY